MSNEPKRYYFPEAAEFLGCSPKTLKNKVWCDHPQITSHKDIRGRIYFLEADLIAYRRTREETRKADVWVAKKSA